VEVKIKNLQKKIPIPRSLILKTAAAAFRKLGSAVSDLSVVFLGEKRIRLINKKYLGHDYVTDVLTFDLGQGCAEIIICPKVAAANAISHKTSTEKEIILYVIHGILHLKGFDDHTPKDILQMRKMENELL
jgi:probable rRNA maturation factor